MAPEYRKSNYADALIRYAQHCQEKLGVPLLIGVLTNLRMLSKVRLYRRRLGMPAGAFFVEGAEWVNERAPDLELWKHTRKRKKQTDDLAPLEAVIATAVAEGQLPLINGKLS